MPEALRMQYVTHIRVYAELLYRAGLLEARNEVLKFTGHPPLELQVYNLDTKHLGARLLLSNLINISPIHQKYKTSVGIVEN
jgi:hypothetical protein